MTPDFRCAAASQECLEDQAGSASTVRAFLLVESPGPWGADAVVENRLPSEVTRPLADRAARAGVRILVVRRHGRRSAGATTVFAAHADAVDPWLERAVLTDPSELLSLDLDALGSGRSPGLAPHDDPLFLVCTHGRHDVCCAERGRPVAAALQGTAPEQTWEVSHIGGDRFAGNVLVLPDGLYYGRVTPQTAPGLATSHRGGVLDLDLLRGRSGHTFAVQAAEIALRRRLGEVGLSALKVRTRNRSDDVTRVVFDTPDGPWDVRVQTTRGSPRQLTCRAPRQGSPTTHTVLSVEPLEQPSGRG